MNQQQPVRSDILNCFKKWTGRVFIIMLSIMLFSHPALAATYTYDDLNRVIKVDYGNGKEINYTYDSGGNITSVTSSGIESVFTDILLEGTEGNNGWYRSDVKVTLTALNNGGTGAGGTEYSLDGTNWIDYTAPFTISNEGTSTVYYRSAAEGGVEAAKEKEVKVDKTPPVIAGAAATQPNAKGWYNADVTVNFTATDEGSGLDSVTPATVVSAEGAGQTVKGTAVDRAGNTATLEVTGISIDKGAPTADMYTR
jgi:YD repeat-containing protein